MANDEKVRSSMEARRIFADMTARYRRYVDAIEAEGDAGERPSQAQLYQDIMALAAAAEVLFRVQSEGARSTATFVPNLTVL